MAITEFIAPWHSSISRQSGFDFMHELIYEFADWHGIDDIQSGAQSQVRR